MKTPKVATPKPKLKFNTPKSGIVRKSLGNNSTASLKKLSTKGKEHMLSVVKDNEANVEFKNKTPKKGRMSLPANVLRNSKPSPENRSDEKTLKKSPNTKKLGNPESPKSGKKNKEANKTPAKHTPVSKPQNLKKTPQNKNVPENLFTPASVENNTSPVKQNVELKKNKVPFNLDDSLATQTPNGLGQKKRSSSIKAKPNSPEVELGLQLEEALSPKSKKEKKKKMSLALKVAAEGKVTVNQKVVKKLDTTSNTVVNSDSKKKKRRRNRKSNQKKVEQTNLKKVEPKPSFLKHINVMNAITALLKSSKSQKADLLSGDDYIFLQFSLFKVSKDAKGVYKVALPHCILPDSPEVCLVVPDLKGKRNEPEEAIDHYKELLKNNDITSITEIIPVRKLKQEYSQFEESRRLANRFDCIISDGRITHIAKLGKRFARAKKCICPIKFNSKTLKEDIARGLRKVAIFSSGRGTSFSVKCGRRGMSAGDIADNIVAIGEFLANNETLIGEPLNISLAAIKTSLSSAFPVYVSAATPNDVRKPKGKQREIEEPVEDEISTVQDGTVVVYPSGNVKVKKRKNEESKDDADLKQKGIKKSKTNVSKKVKVETDSSDDDDIDDDSDVDIDSSNDDDLAVDSLNGTDDEASDDESEVEGEDEEEEEEEEDDDDDDDDRSIDEGEIEAAEKAYLEELRILQEEIGKKKAKKSSKTANVVEKKEDKVTQQKKSTAVKGEKKLKKGLQKEQNQTKKGALKEQDTNTKGKKADKLIQQKGNRNQNQKENKFGSPQTQQKGNRNQNQKENKFGSPQNQQKGKIQHFGQGKGPNKKNAQKGGSPKQGKKQFKKGPGGKNKN
ncbi:unnamed protein product [Nezara viridula]|uniref:Ribosomal L1 domain-containing protein 1 n=1 Tax=Nezara viridula TaxID=85310 RepID=A0A9P0H034_NEZVI|nr:unnamed protein product [Nezara viridula]